MTESPEPLTGVVLDEETVYTLGELSRASGVRSDWLIELVRVGILEPSPERGPHWTFTGRSVTRLQTALRLERDLGVNPEGAALALDLLEEMASLRRRAALAERRLAD
jgi:chaperone modulatory protein CbpM